MCSLKFVERIRTTLQKMRLAARIAATLATLVLLAAQVALVHFMMSSTWTRHVLLALPLTTLCLTVLHQCVLWRRRYACQRHTSRFTEQQLEYRRPLLDRRDPIVNREQMYGSF